MGSIAMAFITDKEKLKSGLIIFRRGDVAHRNFYCRIKLPKEDRYKTIALGTADRQSAPDQAFDLDADIRFRIKHDVPVFNRPFRQVAEEYIAVQQRRAKLGEVATDSVKNIANRCRRVLHDYIGSTLIHFEDRRTDVGAAFIFTARQGSAIYSLQLTFWLNQNT
jgi:integrase